MILSFPTDFSSLSAWANQNQIPVSEARSRFAQFGVIRAIASSNSLSRNLVFKGGNALDFVWISNRSTRDLDFSSISDKITETGLRQSLGDALRGVERDLRIQYGVQRIERRPPGPDKTHATFQITVGYAMPDAIARELMSLRTGQASSVIPIDVSINEVICDYEDVEVFEGRSLLVSTREDIYAEKLRALLQQAIRNRGRRQDLLDLAYQISEGPLLDSKRLSRILEAKCQAREIVPTKSAFQADEVFDRAREGYDDLASTTRNVFVPFEVARELLLGFVQTLDIPE